LDRITDELEVDLNSFPKLLAEERSVRHPMSVNKRTKRGLLNVFGYRLKYLFGTTDARDVKRLTAVCGDLQAFEK
jgi:hypothetical protein